MKTERLKEIEKKRYIPKDYTLYKTNKECSDLLFYTNNGSNNFWSAICYTTKSFKHTWFYRFKDEQQMVERMNNTISIFNENRDRVEKNRQERFKPHTLKINDILYCSWGYDQTNIDFYKIKELIGKNKVKVVSMSKDYISGDGSSNIVKPDQESKNVSTYLVDGKYNSIRIHSFASARKWDGKPLSQTDSLCGH